MTKKQMSIIALMLMGAVFSGGYILKMDKPKSTDEHASLERHEPVSEKGIHGGKLLSKNGYSIEVKIFEQGVEPEFHIYIYQNGKILSPDSSAINLMLYRLGRQPQSFMFVKEKDYFKSTTHVEEPHSFKVVITATHNGKSYDFSYEQDEARITMTEEQIKKNAVEVRQAAPARIKNTLYLTGEVGLNEDRTVHIVPRLPGMVESVHVNAGGKVKKGQLLVVISSQALSDQRSEWLTAQKRVLLARNSYNREKTLWEEKISAEQDYLHAQHALQEANIALRNAQQKLAALGHGLEKQKGNLTRYEIRAPIDGIITQKHVSVGEALKEDTNIFVIADTSSVWIEALVPAKDLPLIKIGQKIVIKSISSPMEDQGVISYIGHVLNEQSRSAKVRMVLPNKQEKWHAGLPVNAEVIVDEIEVPIAVSIEGLQTIRDWNVVFGRYGDFFEARPLVLGRRDDRFVEVLKGLNIGEKYASKNSFLIKADLEKSGASHDH